jgi:hypothetical protein
VGDPNEVNKTSDHPTGGQANTVNNPAPGALVGGGTTGATGGLTGATGGTGLRVETPAEKAAREQKEKDKEAAAKANDSIVKLPGDEKKEEKRDPSLPPKEREATQAEKDLREKEKDIPGMKMPFS